MRDILQSSKGRTKTQRDYGRDAGDYVPLLERRPHAPRVDTVNGPYRFEHRTHGWNSGALSALQSAPRADANDITDAFRDVAASHGESAACHLRCMEVPEYASTRENHCAAAIVAARRAFHFACKVAR